jgi:quinolinate synthase
VNNLRDKHPEAEFLVHPECGCLTPSMYYLANGDISSNDTHILSTEGMIRYAKESCANRFIIATEVGILHRMKKDNPCKTFLPVNPDAICEYMKQVTLDTVYKSLKEMIYQVRVPKNIAIKARKSIDKMLELT